jgi:hypothetical protein
MDILIGMGVILIAVALAVFALLNRNGNERWNQTPDQTLNDVLERERMNKWGRPF